MELLIPIHISVEDHDRSQLAYALRAVLRSRAETVYLNTSGILSRLEDIFSQTANLKSIVICGFTPRFNDGDECTHRQMVYLNGFSEDGPSRLPKRLFFSFPVESFKEEDVPKDAFGKVEGMEGELFGIFGTNWALHLHRNSKNECVFDMKEYEPPY